MKKLILLAALASASAFAVEKNDTLTEEQASLEIVSGDFLNIGGKAEAESGKIIVKVADGFDLSSIESKDGVTVTQAYKQFYIVNVEKGAKLSDVAAELNVLPHVVSATVDKVNLEIQTH